MEIKNKVLISVNEVDINENGEFINHEITEIGNNCFRNLSSLKKVYCKNVVKVGDYCFRYCASLSSVSIPKATTVGNYCFCYCASLSSVSIPKATTVGDYCFCYCASLSSVSLPKATKVGDYCFCYCDALSSVSIPKATTVGDYCFRYCASLSSVTLNGKKLKVKNADGNCFVITKTEQVKGITIYTGYNFVKVKGGQIEQQPCYVAEKGKFTAHGETKDKAVEDLRFKRVAEKLKKQPILPETRITINHYRLITGSCELGVKRWMQEHSVPEGITAKELLPLLEKFDAYGKEKFKELLKF